MKKLLLKLLFGNPKRGCYGHFKFWNLDITHFTTVCGHAPLPPARLKLVKIDMKVNGPNCKTIRWWLYLKTQSFCIDWR